MLGSTSTNLSTTQFKFPTHVVSVSKQITVFAEDQGFAAGLATFADKVKGRLLTKLMMRDAWRSPIIVLMRTQTNTAARAEALIESSAYQSGRTLKYQINCVVPPPVHVDDFVRELVQVLCTEIANRDTPSRSTLLAVPPLWFTEGMTQNLLGDIRSIELDLLERATQSQQAVSLKSFVNAEKLPPKGVERELYLAKCKLLVRGLFVLSDGPRRGQRFLASLKPGVSWWVAFESNYVEAMTDAVTAEDWWAGQIKRRSEPSPFNRLGAQETDARLTKLLTMEAIHRDSKSGREETHKVSWMELRNYLEAPGTKEMIDDRIRQLEMLQMIGHQSYVPTISFFIEALNHIRLDRYRMLGQTLKNADAALKTTRAQSTQITESLDKLEAQQMNRDLLFLYRDYFQTFEEIKSIEKSRDNAIKGYLDRFQANETAPQPLQ